MQQIKFAKGLSDSIVKRKGDEKEFEEHTKRRLEEKSMSSSLSLSEYSN